MGKIKISVKQAVSHELEFEEEDFCKDELELLKSGNYVGNEGSKEYKLIESLCNENDDFEIESLEVNIEK